MAVGPDPAIGAELGGYRLEALVGRGGTSAVYRAEDLRLGRRVALKFLAPELAQDARFREALVAIESGVEQVYLADVGLTKHATSRGGPTATGQMVGTVDYVAPEQIRGEAVDGRADLYSLGCVLYECLTGEVPFPRGSEIATINAHLEDDPPRASAWCSDLTPAMDAVIGRAMAKDPGRRWQTGHELAAAARGARALGVGGQCERRDPRCSPRSV